MTEYDTLKCYKTTAQLHVLFLTYNDVTCQVLRDENLEYDGLFLRTCVSVGDLVESISIKRFQLFPQFIKVIHRVDHLLRITGLLKLICSRELANETLGQCICEKQLRQI